MSPSTPLRILALLALAVPLSGCELLGIESPQKIAESREAERSGFTAGAAKGAGSASFTIGLSRASSAGARG
jgi:hypothetical protein